MKVREAHRNYKHYLVAVGLATMLGCGSSEELIPLEGSVTLAKNPLANAMISFERISKDGLESSLSYGLTDATGRFTLTSRTGTPGVAVGTHRVMISANEGSGGGEDDTIGAVPIPEKYGARSQLTFIVSADGTPPADFVLEP